MSDIEITHHWRDLLALPAGARARFVIGAGAVLVIGLLVAATRDAPAEIAPPARPRSSPQVGAGELYVHVAGLVRSPGLYRVTPGARVADAIGAAGGPLRRGDLDALNLAQLVTDGMKIEVPRRGSVEPEGGVDTGALTEAGLVSINSADQAALETIPGIGPVRAGAILAYRAENGGFAALEELLEVTGIGPATYEGLLPYVTL